MIDRSWPLYGSWQLFAAQRDGSTEQTLCRSYRGRSLRAARTLEAEYSAVRRLEPMRALYPVAVDLSSINPAIHYRFEPGLPLVAAAPCPRPAENWLLPVLVAVARALASYHAVGMTHGRLSPWSILVDVRGDEAHARLFGGYGRLPAIPWGVEEVVSADEPALWSYLSPEHFDEGGPGYPGDIYGFGVVAYELITAQAPFAGNNLSALAHAHRAVPPRDIRDVRPDVSGHLSAIVMRCLEKSPRARCADAHELVGELEPIAERSPALRNPPTHGGSVVVRIPDRLYGREREIESIVSAFRESQSGRHTVVHVSGPPGIGKTAVVRAALEGLGPVNLAWAKLDQIQNRPHESIIQLLEGIARALAEEEKVETVEHLTRELARDAALLTSLAPALSRILGKRDEPTAPRPGEEPRRFHAALRSLFSSVSSSSEPWVFVFDDAQWMEEETVEALTAVARLGGFAEHFVVVLSRDFDAAVRDAAIRDSAERVERLVSGLSRSPSSLRSIRVSGLSRETAARMLRDAGVPDELHHVAKHSEGNPFYIRELLIALAAHLEKSTASGVSSVEIPSTLVGLLERRIAVLSEPSLSLIRAASVLGGVFERDVVSRVCTTASDNAWRELVERDLLRQEPGGAYRFSHDRIEQVVYDAMSESERRSYNRAVGRALLESAQSERETAAATSRLNAGRLGCEDEVECLELARLNVRSSRWALRAVAYAAAFDYAEQALGLARDAHDDPLHVEAHTLRSLAAVHTKDSDAVEESYEWLKQCASSPLALVPAARALAHVRFASNRGREAIDVLLSALDGLGVRIARNPGALRSLLTRTAVGVFAALHPSPPTSERLASKRVATPTTRAALELLGSLFVYCYLSGSPVLPSVVLRMVRTAIHRQPISATTYALVGFGALLSVLGTRYDVAIAYGATPLPTADPPTDYDAKAEVLSLIFVRHYCVTPEALSEDFQRVYRLSKTTGDLESAAHSIHVWATTRLTAGVPLDLVAENVKETLEELRHIGQTRSYDGVASGVPLIETLRGEASFEDLYSHYTGENGVLERYRAANDTVMWIGTRHMMAFAALHSGRYRDGEESAEALINRLDTMRGTSDYTVMVFEAAMLTALIADTVVDHLSASRRLAACSRLLRRFRRIEGGTSVHRSLAVDGERAALSGSPSEAVRLITEAHALAVAGGFLHEAGLAAERAAAAYDRLGARAQRDVYLREAFRLYDRWNGRAKLRFLEDAYPDVLGRLPPRGEREAPGAALGANEVVDRETVFEVTRAISGEVEIGPLLSTILDLAARTTAATRGVLFVAGDNTGVSSGRLVPSRVLDAPGPVTDVSSTNDVGAPTLLAERCVEIRRMCALGDAAIERTVVADGYFMSHRPESFVVVPVIHRNEVLAVLYLECDSSNRMGTGASREIVALLCRQAAVSIANARLHSRRIESERTAVSLLEAVDQGVAIVSPEGEILAANRVFAESPIVRLTPVQGRPVRQCTNIGGVIERIRSEAQRLRTPLAQEVPWADRVYTLRVNPVVGPDNRVLRCALVVADATEERVAESKRQEEQRRLAIADRLASIGILTASVAHEINNPNHVVTLQASFLRDAITQLATILDEYLDDEDLLVAGYPRGELIGKLVASVNDIAACSEHISLVVQDLRNLAAGGRDVAYGSVEVSDVCGATVRMASPLIRRYTDKLNVDLEEGLPSVWGSERELRQVVLNLVQNACQALPDRTKGIRVRTRRGPDEGSVRIIVQDDGRGMTEAEASRATEAFYTTKGREEGTGLGLAICAAIVREHRGSLRLDSRPGKGTTVTIELPIASRFATAPEPSAQGLG